MSKQCSVTGTHSPHEEQRVGLPFPNSCCSALRSAICMIPIRVVVPELPLKTLLPHYLDELFQILYAHPDTLRSTFKEWGLLIPAMRTIWKRSIIPIV